jgi:hypothetical protein
MKSNYLENRQINRQLLSIHVNEINVLSHKIKVTVHTFPDIATMIFSVMSIKNP